MEVSETSLSGVFIVHSDMIGDERGAFVRTFCRDSFHAAGIDFNPTQASESHNKHEGTLRGMHFQSSPHEEQKLVRCTKGRIFDVAVDIRLGSATFGDYFAITLTEDDTLGLYIPKGFAHGFQALSRESVVSYFISPNYATDFVSGFRWDDPDVAIDWPILPPAVMSERDCALPYLKDLHTG
jgi:dTDP-4-dehydrorhamnose 3,5-epimerase